jgi:hypothetical protein
MSATMSCIDETRPPGVLIDMSTKDALRFLAVSSAW